MNALIEDVRAWIAENGETAPTRWIDVANRLCDDFDMEAAWKEFAKCKGVTGRHVLSWVLSAYDDAQREVKRTLPEKEELTRLRAVHRAAEDLLVAIEKAPHLKCVNLVKVNGKRTSLAWRKDARNIMPSPLLSIEEVVRYAADWIPEIIENRPKRIVKKQRERQLEAAFVRNFAENMKELIGKATMSTISHVTNAALGQADVIDKEQVKGILK